MLFREDGLCSRSITFSVRGYVNLFVIISETANPGSNVARCRGNCLNGITVIKGHRLKAHFLTINGVFLVHVIIMDYANGQGAVLRKSALGCRVFGEGVAIYGYSTNCNTKSEPANVIIIHATEIVAIICLGVALWFTDWAICLTRLAESVFTVNSNVSVEETMADATPALGRCVTNF